MKGTIDMTEPFYIDSGKPGPQVLITAGVHGDEYEPILAAIKLTGVLSAGLLTAGKVAIITVVNPTAATADSRYGADGLDLARICPGKADGTVSEQSAAAVSALIKQADYYIDMHTGGKLFNIYPLAGYMLHTSAAVLKKQQDMAKAFNLPVIWGTDSAPNGRTLSVARDAHVPAIYVEYGGGNSVNEEIITAYTTGCLNVLNSLGMIQGHSVQTDQVKYWVENYLPNTGHLQVKLPSPAEGIFIPTIHPGQPVKKGQLWGTITAILTHQKTEILADEEGIVLFVRDAAYVKAGDPLGGILPAKNTFKTIINGK